jgi:hypothetical protein
VNTTQTQPITPADIRAGRIRIPVDSKSVFPDQRQRITIVLVGTPLEVAYDPRMAPDKERSGVLYVGQILEDLVRPSEVLQLEKRRNTVALGRIDQTVQASTVRYIKLGRGGDWETECLDGSIARFGTRSADADRFALASAGRFDDLRTTFVRDGSSGSSATRFANDTRAFFSTDDWLWITFSRRRMWWARFAPAQPYVHQDGDSTVRRTVGRWSSEDVAGQPLWMEALAGFLTKSEAYRGTTFALPPRIRDYVIRRINGRVSPEATEARQALLAVRKSAVQLMRMLEPKDFELLVDLVFTSSGGWRRVSDRGKTMKAVDMIVEMPSTQERAWIQVKSNATPGILDEVVASGEAMKYDRAFFVHHSGTVGPSPDPKVTVIGPDALAVRIVDSGLVAWLIDNVS